VAVAVADRLADQRRGLEPASADDRHTDRALDLAGVRQGQPLDSLAAILHPPPAEQLAERPGPEDDLVAERVSAAGDHRVVGAGEVHDWEVAGRVPRVWER